MPGSAACTKHRVPSVSQLASSVVASMLAGAVEPIIGIGSASTGMSQPRSASQLSAQPRSMMSGDTGVMRNEYGCRRLTSSRLPNTAASISRIHGAHSGRANESLTCLEKLRASSAL